MAETPGHCQYLFFPSPIIIVQPLVADDVAIQLPLKLEMAIRLSSSQWDVNRSDTCSFQIALLKGGGCPPLTLSGVQIRCVTSYTRR